MTYHDKRKPEQHTAGSSTGEPKSHNAGTLATLFARVRNNTERLVETLSEEDSALQSMPDASPVKWHLAHTSWFFDTFLLERFELGYTPFDPSFRVLFNSYYNGVGDKHPRPERGLISRPDLARVLTYRREITRRIAALLDGPDVDPEFTSLVLLGCNHEEQHQELILTDLKHLLSRNPLKPAFQRRWPLTPIEARKPRWIRFDGGLREIGHAGDGFAFDNETPRHKVFVHPFQIASHPVTHGDFAAFVDAGGYCKPELWLSLGWDWVQANDIKAPMYWERINGGWQTFTLHGTVAIDPNTPVCHINYFEADAYARWANARLPRETEWEIAAENLPVEGNFVESQALHPLALREETPADMPAQMFGDVWEWTQSAYLPYPGFRIADGAVGEYNGKFMCNQFVLRGGSCVSPQRHLRASYRNFFPPEARWQFSGLRLARDID